jgi:hypothetical protein
MISIVTKSKRYPEFIRNHSIFKELRTVKKVFPQIGLKNCEVSASSIDKHVEEGFKRKKIVFSSDGSKGLWDMATMSERGIDSCQGWDSDEYLRGACCNKLVGSMVDPYAGIIYIAGKRMSNGRKMEHRCVVRLVLNRRTKKPAVLLERTYHSNDYDNSRYVYVRGVYRWIPTQDKARALFKKFIETKLGLPVIDSKHGYSIPLSEPVAKLKKEFVSYRDSHIGYSKVRKTKKVIKYLVPKAEASCRKKDDDV